MRISIKIAFPIILFLSISFSGYGQNYVNTPYSRFGIGDLINTGLSYNRSMGGSSIALRPANQINYLNPASYTSQDTLSFLFQGGATGHSSLLSSENSSGSSYNMNIEYLAMGFPITNFWKFSIGLVPYSRIQYFFRETPYAKNEFDSDEQPEPDYVTIDYKGNGGFNEFYFGTAFAIGQSLSLGINGGYLFGSLDRLKLTDMPNYADFAVSQIDEKFIANDFYLRIGLQAFHTFSEKHKIILGITYDSKTKIKIKQTFTQQRLVPGITSMSENDPIYINYDSINYLKMPPKFGIGLTHSLDDRLLVTIEYSQQNFSRNLGISGFDRLRDYSSFRFGTEYVPTPMSDRTRAKYYERMHYRLGAHYTNTYLSINNTAIKDYGISLGLGFPWRNSKKLYTHSAFNLSYQYGIRGTTDNGLIKENYHIVTIGFTLHDFWFIKSKYD